MYPSETNLYTEKKQQSKKTSTVIPRPKNPPLPAALTGCLTSAGCCEFCFCFCFFKNYAAEIVYESGRLFKQNNKNSSNKDNNHSKSKACLPKRILNTLPSLLKMSRYGDVFFH